MSQSYVQLLLSPEWRTVKELILDRDCHTCQNCQSKENPQVHHIHYIGNYPWDTPHGYLITLCDACHKSAHTGKHINSFKAPDWLPIRRGKQVTKDMIKRKIKRDLLIRKLRIKR
jgi:5-methylcytosine-specific restriction endonuclease McrA